jgi:hypothetical protein
VVTGFVLIGAAGALMSAVRWAQPVAITLYGPPQAQRSN